MLQQSAGGAPAECAVAVRFHAPPEDLRRYFTTFYCTEVTVPEGGMVRDSLQPEWANLRLFAGAVPVAAIGSGPVLSDADFIVTGPSSLPLQFEVASTRLWGIGLLPLGWAQFVGEAAADYANLAVDGRKHPAFVQFVPLARTLFGAAPDEAGEAGRIAAFFRARLDPPCADQARIGAVHAALIDPELHSVGDLVARCGLGQRTLERFSRRHFGFAPKLLMRRQRFMRSLAQFMLDPSLKWIGALDGHYHDQAQFVRDFREFMGETPREYAGRPHPILTTFMRERMRVAGSAVQTTDRPEGPVLRP